MAYLHPDVLDSKLDFIRTNATALLLCTAQPTDRANALAIALSNTASPTIGANADATTAGGDPADGRKAEVAAVSAEDVDANGDASHWALISGTILLASNTLAATKTLVSGSTVDIDAFDIVVPSL